MSKKTRKKGKSGDISHSRRNVKLAGGVAAVAVATFLLGYLAAQVYKDAGAPPREPAGQAPERADAYPTVKPKILDADSILAETKKPAEKPEEPEKFTFPKTLTEESGAAVNPFKEKSSKTTMEAETGSTRKKKPKEAKRISGEAKKRAEKKAAGKKTARAAPAPKRPSRAVAKPEPAGDRLTIQVGSFISRKDAERLKQRLVEKDYNAYIQSAVVKGKKRYRVRVGVFKSRKAALRIAERLKRNEKLPTMLASYKR